MLRGRRVANCGRRQHLACACSTGVGPYVEVAAFHRSSRTLLLVDAAVAVPQQPPPIVPQWALRDAGGSSFFVRLLYGNVSDAQVPPFAASLVITAERIASGVKALEVRLVGTICSTDPVRFYLRYRSWRFFLHYSSWHIPHALFAFVYCTTATTSLAPKVNNGVFGDTLWHLASE